MTKLVPSHLRLAVSMIEASRPSAAPIHFDKTRPGGAIACAKSGDDAPLLCEFSLLIGSLICCYHGRWIRLTLGSPGPLLYLIRRFADGPVENPMLKARPLHS